METLFRFMLKRPAIAQSEHAPSIRLTQDSQFQAALGQAQQDPKPREALKAVARKFVGTPAFIGDPKKLAVFEKLIKLSADLDALEKGKNVSNADVSKTIEDSFGATPANLVKNKTLDPFLTTLKDSIIAIKQLPEEHRRAIEDLTNQLRDLEVILKVVASKDFPGDGGTLRRYRRRSVMLPTEADLRSSLATIERQKELEKQRKEAEEKKRKEAEEKLDLYNRLKAAVKELTSLSGEHFYTTPQQADAGFLVSAAHRPVQVLTQEMTQLQQFSQLNLLRAQAALGKGEVSEKTGGQVASTPEEKGQSIGSKLSKAQLFQSGSPAFKPMSLSEVGFRLKPSAERKLSASTIEILKERSLSISEQPLDHIIEILRAEITSLGKELDALLGRPVKHTFKRMGNTMVMIKSPMPSVWNSIVIGATYTGGYLPLLDGRVPHSHGSVAPAGIADLLVVKQQLVSYEGADVAHIENILKGEKKEREHTRRRETEELLFRESEITTSEERELESTNRFEMSRETSQTIKEDASLKAGLSVSGSYGPTVEFSVSAEGSVSRSKEEATKTAAKFSQDVTQRSANKVTERVLDRSSLRVTNEVTERNSHTLDNVGGDGHISGVYQWVVKKYQAQMFNYGLRTMFDFMVPEPGAFLIEALQSAHANAIEIEKPMPFTLRPNQITESNYHTWVKEYGATDVTPPPEVYITKSLDFKAGGGDSNTNYNHTGQIQIDEGYKAVRGSVGRVVNLWEDSWSVDVVLGSRTHRFNSGSSWVWNTSLDQERDSIPVAIDTFQVSQVAVAVEVKCQRTDRAMMKWRLDTHAKLTNAYKAQLSEYEEKLAALEMQAGVAIEGKNPELNLELMKDELKKNCISILTEQYFDLFDAIGTGTNGLPQIDLYENEAEGPYVRFFEQAFEWEHITWVTYPYFWGRKGQWDERIAYEDTDPLFNQFLKAGYCRVAVPARPGFEGAIDHFMTYGEIWNGGPLPAISNPLYLPIADEIAERLDRPGDEFPEGDPWLVRIPTTLVHLRPDDKLPQWKQDDDGNWVEVP